VLSVLSGVALALIVGALKDAPMHPACVQANASCEFAWAAGNRQAAWLCGKDNESVPSDAGKCRALVSELDRAKWVCDSPESAAQIIRRIVELETSTEPRADGTAIERVHAELREQARRCLLRKAIEYTPQGRSRGRWEEGGDGSSGRVRVRSEDE
jgi:hypothetical protein